MKNCCSYNQLRLIIENDYVIISPCCVKEAYKDYLKIISIEELKKIDNLYEYLNALYKTGTSSPLYKECQLYITDQTINECNWNKDRLSGIDMSITTSCNLTCSMCRNNIIVNNDIDNLYYSCLERIKGHQLEVIYLTEAGEPFLHKNRAIEYIKSLTLNDTRAVHTTTNLTLLNTSDIIDLKQFRDASSIYIAFDVSISGITPDVYSKIHNNKLFDKVMENTLCMNENGLLDHVNFVVQENNINELIEAYEFWLSKGVKFRPVPIYRGGFEKVEAKYNDFMKNIYNK